MKDAQADEFVEVENVHGSAFNDTLSGNTLANYLAGGGGDDLIQGRAGNDFTHAYPELQELTEPGRFDVSLNLFLLLLLLLLLKMIQCLQLLV